MEQKWLAEQKRKKYFEDQALIEEKKTKEISQQLYMIMTNELTPASFKVGNMFISQFYIPYRTLFGRTLNERT